MHIINADHLDHPDHWDRLDHLDNLDHLANRTTLKTLTDQRFIKIIIIEFALLTWSSFPPFSCLDVFD